MEEAKAGIAGENQAIESIKLSRLKSHPMTDAQKKEEEILEASVKELAGIILSEAKDHIEEELEKNKEEAEDKKEQEDNTRMIEQEDMIRELKNIIAKNKLLDEDAKGIVLDEQV